MMTEYKGGLCSTKCGGKLISFFDCTSWWQDVTCPACREAMNWSRHMRPKRRRIYKVPA